MHGSNKITGVLTWVFYELERNNVWLEQNFNFSWLGACIFLNRRISKILYQKIWYAQITKLWKTLQKYWLLVKLRLAAYVFIVYDFIGQIFINNISINNDTYIGKCSTLLHWILWRSLSIIYCSIRIHISLSQKWQTVCLLTKSIR